MIASAPAMRLAVSGSLEDQAAAERRAEQHAARCDDAHVPAGREREPAGREQHVRRAGAAREEQRRQRTQVAEPQAREQRQEQQTRHAEAQRRDVPRVERVARHRQLGDRGKAGPDQRSHCAEGSTGERRGRGRLANRRAPRKRGVRSLAAWRSRPRRRTAGIASATRRRCRARDRSRTRC